jgi:ABC-2 type transport system ATP-binding protein
LQEVEAMASRVILINEGRLVYDGSVAGLDPTGEGLDTAFHRLTATTHIPTAA